ncbi:MAG: type II toxin-antitoxin system RelE/ParE family toxin [Opitutaceae bacterium]|nr:type II toxin-antitoxin system RelE/ParE family toxin [Opitutaceae bacterium]
MRAATQVYSRDFDAVFLKLPADLQARIAARIDEVGSKLEHYPHIHLTGLDCYKLRVGDYRVAYDFDVTKGMLYLLAMGHRREVYR